MAEADKEKLKRLLDYWIEHNREYGDEFKEWAEKATQQMDEANEFLLMALEELKREKEEAL